MSELSTISRHALTVLAGQLAVMAFGVTDTIVAGRYAQEALAALSIGSAVFISVYVGLMGVLQALMPVWAEQRGANAQAAIGRSVRQSLYLWAVATALGMAVLLSPEPILRWTEVPPELRGAVRAYLAILAFGLPPALLFRIYSTLNQALGHPQLVTWLQVGSLALKLPLSIWFTFGGAGLAPQGVAGNPHAAWRAGSAGAHHLLEYLLNAGFAQRGAGGALDAQRFAGFAHEVSSTTFSFMLPTPYGMDVSGSSSMCKSCKLMRSTRQPGPARPGWFSGLIRSLVNACQAWST